MVFPISDPHAAATDPIRLAALESYDVIGSPPEASFEDIVAVAAEACGAPVALVSFVGADRQWFKARTGFEACETPLEQSVCVYAMQESDLLVIPDLTLDPRTDGNTLVTESPFIRFYAGAPLVSPEGQPLGSLCVIDVEPRPEGLTPAQASILRALARQVMGHLELRRAVDRRDDAIVAQSLAQRAEQAASAVIRDQAVKLRLALEATRVGLFDYDVRAGRLDWDARTRELFWEPEDTVVTYADNFLASLHPDDRDAVDAAVRAALDPAGSGVFEHEHRVVSPDGSETRWISARGRLVGGDDGPRLIGTMQDVTARRESDEQVAAALERYRLVGLATNDAVWDWDLRRNHIVWNDALTQAYGHALDEIKPTGEWRIDQIHPDDRARVYAEIRAVIDGDENEWSHEYRFRCADGRYADVLDRGHLARNPDGLPIRLIGAMLDLTERKAAEEQFRAVFEGANIGMVQIDPLTARAIRVNDKLCEIWGATRDSVIGHSVAKWTPEEDDEARAALHARLARGELMNTLLEKRYRRADGRIVWARVNLVSRKVRGAIQTTAMIEDVTAEREARERRDALVEFGARLRDLDDARAIATVACEILGRNLSLDRVSFGAVEPGAAVVDIEVDWRRGDAASAVGRHPLDRFGDLLATATRGEVFAISDVRRDSRTADHSDAYEAVGIRAMLHVPLVERGALISLFFLHVAAPREWPPEAVAFVQSIADRTRAAIARARAEERQRLLNHELSHRMKNLLTMVQAVAAQTLRSAPDLAAAGDVLSSRLIALGKAHDILLGGEYEAAGLRAIVEEALKPHADRPGRFVLDGPDVEIGSKAALPLILMMHELATNAAKYGALSAADGRVAIEWSVSGEPGARMLRLVWAEHGGPPVSPPTKKGFGTRLIERGLAGQVGANVSLDFQPAGLRCVLEASLVQMQESD
ncbi:PAS domain-containing protein [Hansschlegelia plantiphila]|uniref:Blue-light-activated histidine kinase n=1 Tax=Hansschlegelia plantiphila TaxID=374655 RepID=A0A9W6MUF7_9HYPH|nr:PAS domain-containing protein [Hansschlegelia plantiphila]GLK66776.1 hypothetical protein GCM10008179_04140 [Hansschlegelia plantiphila]